MAVTFCQCTPVFINVMVARSCKNCLYLTYFHMPTKNVRHLNYLALAFTHFVHTFTFLHIFLCKVSKPKMLHALHLHLKSLLNNDIFTWSVKSNNVAIYLSNSNQSASIAEKMTYYSILKHLFDTIQIFNSQIHWRYPKTRHSKCLNHHN